MRADWKSARSLRGVGADVRLEPDSDLGVIDPEPAAYVEDLIVPTLNLKIGRELLGEDDLH